MTTTKDWLPPGHQDMVTHARETFNYLHGGGTDGKINLDRMGFKEESSYSDWLKNEYLPKFNAFNEAFIAWENPATRDPRKIGLLKDTRTAFKQAYRKLYAFLKASPLVTDDDLRAMNMP